MSVVRQKLSQGINAFSGSQWFHFFDHLSPNRRVRVDWNVARGADFDKGFDDFSISENQNQIMIIQKLFKRSRPNWCYTTVKFQNSAS